jgi:hypothetical protein
VAPSQSSADMKCPGRLSLREKLFGAGELLRPTSRHRSHVAEAVGLVLEAFMTVAHAEVGDRYWQPCSWK